MTTRLTRRGRFAVLAGLVAAVALVWLMLDATTPDQCRVSADQLSAACLSLLQP